MNNIKKLKYIYISKKIFFIIFLLSYTSSIFGNFNIKKSSHPNFEFLTKEEGLSNLSVSSIVQDKYGFMWFGSQGGLNKYNGRTIDIYRNDPFSKNVLIHNLIQTMFYDDKSHQLWLGTYQGISCFDISKKTFKNYTVQENNLSNSVIVAITKDNDGIFWAGTLNGLNKIDPSTDQIINYSVPGNVVRDLFVDSKGRLLIGTYQGLCYFDPNKNIVKKIELNLPSPYVMVIKEFQKGILTLGLWEGGAVEINLNTHKILNQYSKGNNVYCITKTNDGTLWIGTWGQGLYVVTPYKYEINFSPQNDYNKFVSSVIYSLYQDKSGILWIGTNGNGIVKFNPRKHNYIEFSSNSALKKIKSGKINTLFRDSKKNLWIEIYDSGVQRYNPKTGEIESFVHNKSKNSLLSNKINDIIELNNGNLLFGTGKGISEYSYTDKQFKDLDILPDNVNVCPLLEDPKNSTLWIGTYMNGLYSYSFKTKTLKEFKHNHNNKSLSDNLVYDLLLDYKQRLWIATNNGLNLYNKEKDSFKTYKKNGIDDDHLGSNSIRILFQDSKNNLWIGTNGGGLSLYNEKKNSFKTYTEKNGLANNTISGIAEDNSGKLWISTMNGISIFNPLTEEFVNLSPDDGIGGWEFNSGIFKEKNGSILFGGSHGVISIPPNFSYEYSSAPKLYITDIKVFHDSIDPSKEFFNDENFVFSPNENSLEFNFNALDYDNPKKLRFSYKLLGFNKEWININNNRNYITFSNLEPGEYTLLVYAKTTKDIVSKIEKVSFRIKKPWTKTNLAYFLYLISFIILIFLITQARERQLIKRKNSQLSALNKKLEGKNQLLESISSKDSLTNLYNRRYFDSKLEELLNLSKRGNSILSLLMLDLDNFKLINDTYGHLAGDNFLIDVAKIIKENLSRNTDFATRYGGDEFAIILYDTNEKGAMSVAKKIKDAVENLPVKNKNKIYNFYTTISIGIGTISPTFNTANNDVIEMADKSLYKSKKNGKNKIFINKKLL